MNFDTLCDELARDLPQNADGLTLFQAYQLALQPERWLALANIKSTNGWFNGNKQALEQENTVALQNFQKKQILFTLLSIESSHPDQFKASLLSHLNEQLLQENPSALFQELITLNGADADKILAHCVDGNTLLRWLAYDSVARIIESGKFCITRILKDRNASTLCDDLLQGNRSQSAESRGTQKLLPGLLAQIPASFEDEFTVVAHKFLLSVFTAAMLNKVHAARLVSLYPDLAKLLIQGQAFNQQLGFDVDLLPMFIGATEVAELTTISEILAPYFERDSKLFLRLSSHKSLAKCVVANERITAAFVNYLYEMENKSQQFPLLCELIKEETISENELHKLIIQLRECALYASFLDFLALQSTRISVEVLIKLLAVQEQDIIARIQNCCRFSMQSHSVLVFDILNHRHSQQNTIKILNQQLREALQPSSDTSVRVFESFQQLDARRVVHLVIRFADEELQMALATFCSQHPGAFSIALHAVLEYSGVDLSRHYAHFFKLIIEETKLTNLFCRDQIERLLQLDHFELSRELLKRSEFCQTLIQDNFEFGPKEITIILENLSFGHSLLLLNSNYVNERFLELLRDRVSSLLAEDTRLKMKGQISMVAKLYERDTQKILFKNFRSDEFITMLNVNQSDTMARIFFEQVLADLRNPVLQNVLKIAVGQVSAVRFFLQLFNDQRFHGFIPLVFHKDLQPRQFASMLQLQSFTEKSLVEVLVKHHVVIGLGRLLPKEPGVTVELLQCNQTFREMLFAHSDYVEHRLWFAQFSEDVLALHSPDCENNPNDRRGAQSAPAGHGKFLNRGDKVYVSAKRKLVLTGNDELSAPRGQSVHAVESDEPIERAPTPPMRDLSQLEESILACEPPAVPPPDDTEVGDRIDKAPTTESSRTPSTEPTVERRDDPVALVPKNDIGAQLQGRPAGYLGDITSFNSGTLKKTQINQHKKQFDSIAAEDAGDPNVGAVGAALRNSRLLSSARSQNELHVGNQDGGDDDWSDDDNQKKSTSYSQITGAMQESSTTVRSTQAEVVETKQNNAASSASVVTATQPKIDPAAVKKGLRKVDRGNSAPTDVKATTTEDKPKNPMPAPAPSTSAPTQFDPSKAVKNLKKVGRGRGAAPPAKKEETPEGKKVLRKQRSKIQQQQSASSGRNGDSKNSRKDLFGEGLGNGRGNF